ncbi:transglutaminase-like domain-containing protein [Thermoproteota archaeon]
MIPRVLRPTKVGKSFSGLGSLISIGLMTVAGYMIGDSIFYPETVVPETAVIQYIPENQEKVEPERPEVVESEPQPAVDEKKSLEMILVTVNLPSREDGGVEPPQSTTEIIQYTSDGFKGILDNYNIVITDNTFSFPVKIDGELYSQVKEFRSISDEKERAKAIFDWQRENVAYGSRKRSVRYRDSVETLHDKEGVCGETAYLYIALARASDLEVKMVDVELDYRGKEVNHSCAVVFAGDEKIFVDPAYRAFGINHQKFSILSDAEMYSHFDEWRSEHESN